MTLAHAERQAENWFVEFVEISKVVWKCGSNQKSQKKCERHGKALARRVITGTYLKPMT